MAKDVLADLAEMAKEEGSGMTLHVETPAAEPAAPVIETPTETNPKIEAPIVPAETVVAPVADTPKVEPQAPVVAEPTPAPVHTPEPTPAPEVDVAKILDEMSGGQVKSKEELSKILAEYKEAQSVMQDPNYEYAQKLSAWKKEGRPAELFHAVQNVKTDELSVEDTVKLKMKLENPEWTKEDIELFMKEEYKQDPEANNEQAVKYGQLRMQRDATAYKPELNKLKNMTVIKSNPAEREAQIAQAENVRKEGWKQQLPKLVNEFNSVTVPTDLKGGQYEYKLTQEQKSELQATMENLVLNAPIQIDENGINVIKDAIKREFIYKNINQIVQSSATSVASKKAEEHIVAIHNPTGAIAPKTAPVIDKKSSEDEAFEKILKMEGIRRR